MPYMNFPIGDSFGILTFGRMLAATLKSHSLKAALTLSILLMIVSFEREWCNATPHVRHYSVGADEDKKFTGDKDYVKKITSDRKC